MANGGIKGSYSALLPAPALAKLDTGQVKPLQQGDLDGLCGLYAAINALRLVLAPVRQVKRPEALLWFRTGLEFLGKTGNLEDTIAHGMGPQLWLDLIKKLAAVANGKNSFYISVSQPLEHAKPANRAQMYEAIEEAVLQGRAVLISLSGVHDHYTVVSGFSPFSLRLFDSGHLQRIGRADCGTQRSGDKWRHRVNARTLTVLSLDAEDKSTRTTVTLPV